MGSGRGDGQDELKRLQARVDYLEEANRYTLEALELAARLVDFQPKVGLFGTSDAILGETACRVCEILDFDALAIFLVDNVSMEFVPAFVSKPCEEGFFLSEFDRLAEEHTVAWSLQRNRATTVPTADGDRQLLLHPVRTSERTLGMFMGVSRLDLQYVYDSSLAILSIVLQSCANALDNLSLRRSRERALKDLEDKVDELAREVDLRRQSELGLESTRNFLNEVINTVPEPIFVKARKHRFLMVNDAMCFFTDQTRESLIGKTSYDIFPRDEADAFHRRDAKVMLSGREDMLETVLHTPDGLRHEVSVKKASLTDPETGENVLVGIISDRTELKRAERQLRLEHERFFGMLEHLPAFIYVQGRNRVSEYGNRAFRDMFGAYRGKRCYELFRGNSEPCADCVTQRVIDSGLPVTEERVYESGLTFQVSIHPFDDADGERKVIAMGIDVTERAMMEKALRKAKSEAEAASVAKSEFLANTSHEIRTPLNGVLGMLQLASASDISGELRDYVETALESGRSLLTVINDILDISKIEAGKFEIGRSPFSPRHVVESVVQTFAHHSRETGIALSLEVSVDVPQQCIGDAGRVRQVLFNLVGNAMKFTNAGSVSVSVSTIHGRCEGCRRLLFIVEDTGIGIPDDKIDYVFDAFTQVDGSYRRQYQGSGLGLGIVKRLLFLMGGTISIDTEVGRGTTIAFALDFEEVVSAAVGRVVRGLESRIDPSAHRLLLAEDNRVNQIMARKSLERGGYVVDAVDNGEQAIEAMKRQRYDCILLDVQMPVVDGVEVTRLIRERGIGENGRDVPIVALTAHAMSADRDRFLSEGMNAVVAKPYDVEDLLETVAVTLVTNSSDS